MTSSLTAIAVPPDSRTASSTRKSPSALGTLIPNASVCVPSTSVLSSRPALNASTIGGQPVDCTATSRGSFDADPAELLHLLHRLVDADQPDPAAGRVEDDVGHLPAELLGDLVAHRLLALDAVRLLERRDLLVAVRSATASLTSAPAWLISPSTRYSSAPATTHSRRVISGASTGITIRLNPSRRGRRTPTTRRRRCRSSASRPPSRPSSRARETPTAAPRALKVPVGISPSSFISRLGTPIAAPYVGNGSSGVIPSPSVVTCAGSRTGSTSW